MSKACHTVTGKAKYILIIAMIIATTTVTSHAELAMPRIFGDNMVLQRGDATPVWGTADPGDTVSVALDTLNVVTTADETGKWSIGLNTPEDDGPYTMTIAAWDSTVAITDTTATATIDSLYFGNVLIGEVWVCSGQSNMDWRMRNLYDAEDDIAAAKKPEIRLFTVPKLSSETPLDDLPESTEGWSVCTPDTVLSFSAVGYYFGSELHSSLRSPIGLIHTSWGGSPAESWTTWETLSSRSDLTPIIANLDEETARYDEIKARCDTLRADWRKAMADSLPLPPMVLPPRAPGERDWPSGLYNAMIHPIIPFGIAGAIWYQGESNSVRARQYATLFPAMIEDWRKAWNAGDFPFIFVQLANWETSTIPVEGTWGSWPELREAQLETLRLPNTGMAVTIDIGETDNIHPNNKKEVGHRLALNALTVAYKRLIVKCGPIYTAMFRDGQSIRLRFRHTADGLVAGNMMPLSGFEIAGKDRVFYPADATIANKEVIVVSNQVPHPVAVRYGWDDNPVCNLYNSAGLPASPFRTDTWPALTEGALDPRPGLMDSLATWTPQTAE